MRRCVGGHVRGTPPCQLSPRVLDDGGHKQAGTTTAGRGRWVARDGCIPGGAELNHEVELLRKGCRQLASTALGRAEKRRWLVQPHACSAHTRSVPCPLCARRLEGAGEGGAASPPGVLSKGSRKRGAEDVVVGCVLHWTWHISSGALPSTIDPWHSSSVAHTGPTCEVNSPTQRSSTGFQQVHGTRR